ncbi:MAG: Serine/threonine protein kinase [Gemmataceae bacterium]|nr:Serine/threonine protein kinase [Gemmataceae bacterium]
MPEPEKRPNVLFYLAAEGVIPVLGGCAGALAGGPSAGIAGVAVGHVVEKAINLFGRGIVERWRGWFARNPGAAQAAVVELAALPPAGARAEAKSIILELAPAAAAIDLSLAVEFLSAIPCAVDRALVPDPAGGRSLPPTVAFDDPRSLLQLLPENVPPYPPSAALPDTPYQLVELLGAGGFGAVYRAVSPTLQHLPLAIKFCLDRSLLPALNQERSNLERLMRAGGRGSGHVVRLYGYDLDHPTPYLVYEYVAGGDLTKLVAARRAALGRAPDPAEVLGWITQIVDGLAFAHRTGLVHRDLKPANILVDAECGFRNAESKTTEQTDPSGFVSAFRIPHPEIQLKLADFGLGGVAVARVAARSRIGTTTLDYLSLADQASLFRGAGTPLYMSPEQRRGAPPDPRHDLYALGVVWYQLVTGDVSRELHHGWAKELVIRYGVPAGHIALIERCVGWFDERPKDAGELLPLLKEAAGQPVSPTPIPSGAPEPVPAASADTVPGASQVTPVPKPSSVSDSGRRRGLTAVIAQLDGVYAELADMTKWRFEITAAYGFLLALLVGGTIGGIAVASTRTEAGGIGIFVGIFVWGLYLYLIRSGVKAVTEDIQKRADGLVEELVNDYMAEVAEWGGRAALRHPATVRQIRLELAPPKPARPPAEPLPVPKGDWSGALQEILADPVRKAAFIPYFRAFEKSVRQTTSSISASRSALVAVPLLVGGWVAAAIAVPTTVGGGQPVWIWVPVGLAIGTGVGVAILFAFRAVIRRREEKLDRVRRGFGAAYPLLTERCGGVDGLQDQQFLASLLAACGSPPRPGFFDRLFGR